MALLERPDDLLLDRVRNPAARYCLKVSLVGTVKIRQGGQGRLQSGKIIDEYVEATSCSEASFLG
jgi:hypothetical protein